MRYRLVCPAPGARPAGTSHGSGSERRLAELRRQARYDLIPCSSGCQKAALCRQCVCSITALCFVDNWSLALEEIVRVTCRRFAIGMLNRHSLLWLEKGRAGGMGAYRGAHWHTPAELRRALEPLPVNRPALASAVFLPGGSTVARCLEKTVPNRFLHGAFLFVAGENRR
ncbi:protein of unknown function [Thauera humireducens]|nr:protein of unknown function [Thauera humireducens]